MSKGSIRVYPSCCTSAYCGRGDCTGCRNLPIKQDFEKWRDEHEAVVEDQTWCPLVYQLRSGTMKATVIVDAGLVSGVVGEDIAVLPDLSPLQVSAIEKAKAVIAATGGPASHLAIVARGQDLTVLRVPGACDRFEPGTRVVLDPKAGTVTIEEKEEEQ